MSTALKMCRCFFVYNRSVEKEEILFMAKKQITVEYGGVKYSREAMTGANLSYLGLRLQPKLIGLGSVIASVVGNKFVQGENLYSYYQCIKDVFDAEDWKWLVDELIYNIEKPLKINDKYITCEEDVDDHFAGDFVRLYTVTLKFAYQNLGEFKVLTENLNGLAGNIANYLKELMDSHLTDIQTSFDTYQNNKKQNQKTGKKRNKV